MQGDRSKLIAAVRAFCAAHPTWVLFDEPSGTLLEVASGKRLGVPLAELVEVADREDRTTGQPYLLVELGDGREFAIASVGIAFPPVRPDMPQAPPLPSVVCLADFRAVRDQIGWFLGQNPDAKPPREAVDLVVLAIAILDGARHLGFDVSEEERGLEGLLGEIERRR